MPLAIITLRSSGSDVPEGDMPLRVMPGMPAKQQNQEDHSGGVVVSFLAIYSDDPSSDPAGYFFLIFCSSI